MVLALVSVTAQMVALAAATGWVSVLATAAQHRPQMAAALVRDLACGGAADKAACAAGATLAPQVALARVAVPKGTKQCPDSGPGATCSTGQSDPIDFGAAALPNGLAACPADPTKPIPNAPGACATPPAAAPSPAAAATSSNPSPGTDAPVLLSPAASKATDINATPELLLSADKTLLGAGDSTVLAATSPLAVDGTPWAIEIFDQATGALVGACGQTSQCTVAFSASAGAHSFVAYVATPTAALPSAGIRLTSNTVNVHWIGVRLSTSEPSVVGPNHPVTFTANASQDVTGTGYAIELWDTTTGQRLTYCSRGLSCSTSLIEPTAGAHVVEADLALVAAIDSRPPVLATSALVPGTWVAVNLAASAAYPSQGGVVSLTATATADLTGTPWAIYIYTASGQLVGRPCSASICAASLTLPGGKAPSFYATIGRRSGAVDPAGTTVSGVRDQVRPDTAGSDVQARSAAVTPIRIMWGVDSCAAFTQDPAGASGLLPQVTSMLGAPDFWGRYLPTTGNCPGLSSAEIAAAHGRHMGILPIFNDYDCSAVSGNGAGSSYALAAINLAQKDVIPLGTAIAIDIEPVGDACPGAGNVDFGFISGWYDQLTRAGYAPAFYGDTQPGSAFANAWCASVQQRPDIANNSYLWSFEPSLTGGFNKGSAPGYSPYNAGCAGKYDAWQYRISDGSTPDVDHDEAAGEFPLWYP